jgi:hypothetical protein
MPYRLSLYEGLQAMAKGLGKPVLFISFTTPDVFAPDFDAYIQGLRKAAPYLFDEDGTCKYIQILSDGEGYLVCDDVAELDRLYDMTVGDDGPTSSNPYDGDVRVSAVTSEGNENT